MKNIYLLFLFTFIYCSSFSQIGINTTTPHASSILDISSSNKGVLFPRISLNGASDNNTIENPAEGLIIYNTNNTGSIEPGLYLWSGTTWDILNTGGTSGGGSSSEGWTLEGNSVSGSEFLGTTNWKALTLKVNNSEIGSFNPGGGVSLGFNSNANSNNAIAIGNSANANQSAVAIGHGASNNGNESVAMGKDAKSNFKAVAIGFKANNSGNESVSLGYESNSKHQGVALGYKAKNNGNESVAIGWGAQSNYVNVAIGKNANASANDAVVIGRNAIGSSQNTIVLGKGAKASSNDGIAIGTNSEAKNQNSVAIGKNAKTTKNNQIVLGNGSTSEITTSADIVTTKTIKIGGASGYVLPSNKGTAGQILQTDGNGRARWKNISALKQDTEVNTKIEVLKSRLSEQQVQIETQQKEINELKSLVEKLIQTTK